MECHFYITKLQRNCKKKAYNNKLNYCKFHYNKEYNVIKNDSKINKDSKIKKDNQIKKDSEIKKNILKEIKRLEKININENNKTIIKKDIYKVLLTIHPDKCKISDIDSHTLTQNLTNVLNKLKI